MSRSSNIERAVRHFGRATGLQHRTCTNWKKEGKISPFQPVPDASSFSQKSFEAFIVHVLAEALRDKQLDSSILGLERVEPWPSGPVLHLHPKMASHIIHNLLPSFDTEYGGVYGVPGLRAKDYGGGRLALVDITSHAIVLLQHKATTSSPILSSHKPMKNQHWLHQREGLHSHERSDLRHWNAERKSGEGAIRSILLSRILRRPKLIDRAGSSHGWANTFTHSYFDLVIESCCGDDPRAISTDLIKSGLLSGIGNQNDWIRSFSSQSVNVGMGRANICVRRLSPHSCRTYDRDAIEKLSKWIRNTHDRR